MPSGTSEQKLDEINRPTQQHRTLKAQPAAGLGGGYDVLQQQFKNL